MILDNLQPALLWKHFENICAIPHPSKHEEKIVEYVKNFGQSLGLETTVDETGNVRIVKPATTGFESKKTVALQAHLDMVPQKNSAIKHDFTKDPLKLRIEEGHVKATNTTLGADNGIGVASILALLESKEVKHGEIVAVFTVDEETGMTGAFNLKPGFINADILINTDSEDENELIVGCAGGIDFSAHFEKKTAPAPAGQIAYTIFIKGLKGGHSGIDINLGRGNANVLLARLLAKVVKKFEAKIASFDGGNMRNAIPREAHALVTVNADLATDFLVFVKRFFKAYEIELKGLDEGLNISCKLSKVPENILEPNFAYEMLKSVTCCPNGVIRMEPMLENIVQTSTNLSIVETDEKEIRIHCLLRSSSETGKADLVAAMRGLFTMFGAKVSSYGSYPGWKPSVNSGITKIFKDVYPMVLSHAPEIKVIHAGLECGIIGNSHPGLDMISFGPTIRHPHSPDEMVSIESVLNYWKVLLAVLENIPGTGVNPPV